MSSFTRKVSRKQPRETASDMGTRLVSQHNAELCRLVLEVRECGHTDPIVAVVADDQIAEELQALSLGTMPKGSMTLYGLTDEHARAIIDAAGQSKHLRLFDAELPDGGFHVLVIKGDQMAHATIVPRSLQ